jgi:hypothetical protein
VAWSPKYIDKPLRFLYDPEVWAVGFVIMGLLILFGMNQTLAIFIMLGIGAVIQRVADHHKKGYILHLFYATGLWHLFCRYGKYRF